jgi:hypothetical protein
MSSDLNRYLEIAKAVKQIGNVRSLIGKVCRAVKCNPHQVGVAKKLIDRGVIQFDEQGNPYYATQTETVEKMIEDLEHTFQKPRPTPARTFRRGEDLEPEEPEYSPIEERAFTEAHKTVTEAVIAEVGREASERAQQYMTIGKTVNELILKLAPTLGYTPEQLAKGLDIEKLIREALSYLAIGPELEEENRKLKTALTFYVSRLDPVVRLEKAMQLLTDFAEFALIADALGFDVEKMPLAKHYEAMLARYLAAET